MGPQIVRYLVNSNCAVSLKYLRSERKQMQVENLHQQLWAMQGEGGGENNIKDCKADRMVTFLLPPFISYSKKKNISSHCICAFLQHRDD